MTASSSGWGNGAPPVGMEPIRGRSRPHNGLWVRWDQHAAFYNDRMRVGMSLRFRQIGRQVTFISLALAMVLIPFGGTAMSAGPESDRPDIPEGAFIQCTATYCERIALPRHAVFEAVLEDVTLADAKATEVGRTVISNPPGPPIRFSIAFDPEKIEAGRISAVRARILVDGKLWFTSTTIHRVLTGKGNGRTVHIALKLVKL